MQLPVQMTFHNLTPAADIEKRICDEAANLDSYYSKIMGCRVMIDVPHKHHKEGNLYNIRIDLTVPGGEIVVRHEPSLHSSRKDTRLTKHEKASEAQTFHKGLNASINEAFDTARRLLQDYARKQRREIKAHESPPRAKISRYFRKKGYGYLMTPNGRRIYFEAKDVQAPLDQIKTGVRVAFLEEDSPKGPAATVIWLL